MKFGITAYVLDCNWHLKKVSHFANFLRGVAGSLESVGHGQQVMAVPAIEATPAKVVGEPRCLGALCQGLELLQMLAIRRLSGAKVHGDPMLDNSIAFKNLVKNMQRPPAIDHVIL